MPAEGLQYRPSRSDATYALSPELAGHDFVDVAPDPGLAGLEGADEGAGGVVEVTGGVFVLRGVAAADVAAGQAKAQVDPGVACLETVLATLLPRVGDFDLGDVWAGGHASSMTRGPDCG